MAKKIVLKVTMEDAKKRCKAFQTAAGFPGVISAALEGDDKIVVVGDGIDPIALTTMLRKKVGFTELQRVEEVKEKEKEKKPEGEAKNVEPVVWPYATVVWPYGGSVAQPYIVQENYGSDPSCSIM